MRIPALTAQRAQPRHDVEAMKKRKEQPSVAGLLLIVAGMVLLSIIMLTLTGNKVLQNAKLNIGLGCAAVASLAAGATLSARRSK
jgi:xanthine/uracil permease